MNRLLHVFLPLFATASVLSGCASFPPNPPLAQYNSDSGYRFEQLTQTTNDTESDQRDKLFVILSLSGGGTRAAALSHGVLKALRDTTIEWQGRKISLLDEVDVITSISGGSFPAAYYALYGDRLFTEFPNKFLYRPIQSDLIKQVFHPGNLVKLAGSSFGRSDLAAEFYNREVFGGGTYGDVIKRNCRPFVVLNATDMNTGSQFPFIQDQFDLLCSDLTGLPLARAAAASSAFPGGLTPLTFKNYAGSCDYQEPAWVQKAVDDHASRINRRRTAFAEERQSYTNTGEQRRDYIHLTDGGVADNIGLRGPLAALSSINHPWSLVRMINMKKIDKLVIITVNAATDPPTKRDASPKVPGLIDTLTTAATVPLDNYSFDTLELLSATVKEYNSYAQLINGCKKLSASKGKQCELEIPAPQHVELFPAQVTFDYLADAEERDWFKALPTTLELPRETVDRLCNVGRRLLREDPEFQKLMKELKGILQDEGRHC